MRLLNGVYAQYFRKETKMRGYLFQDRYKSIVTQDQHYIEEMVRYVHLNPLRAGICTDFDELNQYKWCGHSVVLGGRKWDVQNVNDLLLRFDKKASKARKMYLDFIRDGINTEPDIYKIIRASNSDKEDFHSTASWVVENREFVS